MNKDKSLKTIQKNALFSLKLNLQKMHHFKKIAIHIVKLYKNICTI